MLFMQCIESYESIKGKVSRRIRPSAQWRDFEQLWLESNERGRGTEKHISIVEKNKIYFRKRKKNKAIRDLRKQEKPWLTLEATLE